MSTQKSVEVKMLQVFTTPTGAPDGFEIVSTSARETPKTGKIAECDRYRGIHVTTYVVPGVPAKYEAILLDAVRDTAKAQLAELWKADSTLREVAADLFSIDGILAYAAREAESKKLKTETVVAWFEQSAARERIVKAGANVKTYAELFAKVAAPVMDHTEDDLRTLEVMLMKDDRDAASLIGAQMLVKIRARVAKLIAARTAVKATAL
jgi:hypothetical protein